MSIITKLEVQKKNESRANLYLDDAFYAGISIETCIKKHLKKGVEIDKDALDEIILDDEKSVAMAKATKYMGGALKTTKQIRDYLKGKDFAPTTIDYVIDKMLEYGYLDDENYARSFVLTYSNKYGKLKLRSLLRSKGIKDSILDDILDGEEDVPDNMEVVADKYLKNKELDEKNMARLIRFLSSRGYEFDKIKSYISKIKKGD